MVKNCPVCNGKMKITELKCNDCGLEIKKDFEPDVFSTLCDEQKEFLILFLKCEGNISDIQKKLNLNYSSVKRKISELLYSLKLKEVTPIKETEWDINLQSNRASEIVKSFFASQGGIAKIETKTGKLFTVDADQYTIGSYDGLRDTRYEYKVFDMITELLISKGGEAKKGNGRNFRVGEKGCELDTIAGMVGYKYHKKAIGEYTFDPVFLLVAIMERVGILHNLHGYVRLTEQYKKSIGF
jgi:hypothetical protein